MRHVISQGMANNDGGPAFPLQRNHSNGDAIYAKGDGMSLRDYFAATALIGILPRAFNVMTTAAMVADIASDAYIMADAMLAERSKL